MNNEDMSDMIQKLSSMINNSNNNSENSDISSNSNNINFENLQNMLSNMNFNTDTNDDNFDNSNYNNQSDASNNFNFDFETIMKMKNIMDAFNSGKNTPEANLLLSLKPYLNNNRKQKLDQYIQFLNMSKVIEAFNSNGGVNSK